MGLIELHDVVHEWLEDHDKDASTVRITLVYAFEKLKHFTDPVLRDYLAIELTVQ